MLTFHHNIGFIQIPSKLENVFMKKYNKKVQSDPNYFFKIMSNLRK